MLPSSMNASCPEQNMQHNILFLKDIFIEPRNFPHIFTHTSERNSHRREAWLLEVKKTYAFRSSVVQHRGPLKRSELR